MDMKGNKVLITGGATGIGLALAQRFVSAGSAVIACGRREDKLAEAAKKVPGLIAHKSDVATPQERESLLAWVQKNHPETNLLVNNAGIQRRFSLEEPVDWKEAGLEIAINLDAPIHLSALFVPHLKKRKNPAIFNVTSGLSFSPFSIMPVYCATKAALHSFTLSLRHQLRRTPIRVVEIIPPAVNTDLGGPGLHNFGADLNEFSDSVFAKIEAGELEVSFGTAETRRLASRAELDENFRQMNKD
jgi:uncharacterized oxidoreductase